MTAKAIPATLEPVAGLCAAFFSASSFVLSALPLSLAIGIAIVLIGGRGDGLLLDVHRAGEGRGLATRVGHGVDQLVATDLIVVPGALDLDLVG